MCHLRVHASSYNYKITNFFQNFLKETSIVLIVKPVKKNRTQPHAFCKKYTFKITSITMSKSK